MSSSALLINNIRNKLVASIGITYIVLGTTGNLLNILLFTRPTMRSLSPCIPFMLTASIVNLLNIQSYVMLRMLTGFSITPAYYSSSLCKIQIFIYNVAICLSSWCTVGCCVDRFFSSSRNARVRQYSSMRITYRNILIMASISLILYSQIFYCYDANQTNGAPCNPINNECSIISAVLNFIFLAIGPPVCMLIFGIGTYIHIRGRKQQRRESMHTVSAATDVACTAATSSKKRANQTLLSMILVQVLIFIVCSLPLLAFKIYSTIPVEGIKSKVRVAADNLFLNLAIWMSMSDKIFSFYIYTLTSVFFRRELVTLFTYNRQPRYIAAHE